jgi:adenosylcobinamide-phosphate synthase
MSMDIGAYIFIACLVDLLVGDPRIIPHPVVLMGKTIEILEGLLRRITGSPAGLRAAGVFMVAILVGGSWILTYLLLLGAFQVNYWLGVVLTVWLISTTIAARGLAVAAKEIYNLLLAGNLTEARRKVGWIVSRDTNNMNAKDVTRATVETVAENIVDGIVAPVFYAFIGGAPLAMAYRAANTLDSMVGYKNEKYIDFGMASARLDDLVNYIPARLTGMLLLLAAFLTRKNPGRVISAILQDASRHPSPNGGIPEAAVAGALGIRLGGLNYYHGRESFRPYLGKELKPLEPYHISQVVNLMYVTFGLMVVTGLLIMNILHKGFFL